MSNQYGEPDWANATGSSAPPADTSTAAAGSSEGNWASSGGENFTVATSTANTGVSNVNSGGKRNCFQYLLSAFSIGLAAMMCCLGVFGIMERGAEAGALSEIFVSIYMILFAVLLFLYELMWWKSIDKVNKNLRMNFGFLYGIKGKALYLNICGVFSDWIKG